MNGPARITTGLLTAAARPVAFRFDDQPLQGFAGDTLASALLANGIRCVGRSFKYHRRRGIVSAGPEEPTALVEVLGAGGREPNRPATTLELHEGLIAASQNRWPSLAFDVLAVNGLLARFLPAGFYYKTFMAPGWAWERLYEPLIRRAAGLGRLGPAAVSAAPETVHDHADVLIVGAGAAGLAAAERLSTSGLRSMLLDQDVALGGGTLLAPAADAWRADRLAALDAAGCVQCLPRTTVIGAYGHGVYAALETLTAAESAACGGRRERLRVIRARRLLLATGAVERLIAFSGNDLPGVMLAGAALAYLRRYGVAVGTRPVLFANNDEAYAAVFALTEAGVRCAGIIDVRSASPAAERARALGIEVHTGAVVEAARGRGAIRSVRFGAVSGQRSRELACDCLLVSGGHSPAAGLARQSGAALLWQESIAAFVPTLRAATGRVAGAARGCFGLDAAARDGRTAAEELARELGAAVAGPTSPHALPPEPAAGPLLALWEVPGRGPAFVDLQNDVTAADVRLAHREGYVHLEHMKRYTTHGMGTDQGRIGGLVGNAVLAAARGVPVAEVGQVAVRPFLEPVPFAALAGAEVGAHFKPKRRLPAHDCHEAAAATFVSTGLWLRPLVYSSEPGWEPVLREARNVRRAAGVTDVSSLGKIDVQGPDAARFLDFIYANTFATLAVGQTRYGIMLREDGHVFDDGTTARLGPEHFLVTSTTANAAAVLEHLEFHLQAVCTDLDVVLTDVTDQWAQFAIAGPRAREVVAALAPALDLSNAAFPFMAAAGASVAGLPGRIFRISFSGELAYEVAVPAAHAATAWAAILAAGRSFGIAPYGLDALNTLRIEKGHVTGAELNGNTTADDLGLGRMLKKSGDFVGRVLARRAALAAPDRLQLVGVRPVDRSQRLRNGAHLLAAGTPDGAAASLGYVTSSTPAVELDGWVGLALVAGGRARHGTRLLAASAIHAERTEVDIVSPHHLDPDNSRVRA